MALFDISRSISPNTAVWPEDQSVQWSWTARLGQGDASVNLGSLCLSTHTATHVDAPFHVHSEGKTVDALPLDAFTGTAEVVEIKESASWIRPDHVTNVRTNRVLFKTAASSLPDEEWPDAVVPIHPNTIHRLSQEGAVLVGTDAPSVDPLDSSELPAHHALRAAGIVNLEGLTLREIPEGTYELIALPLRIDGGDAAPVRAVLRDDTST